MDDHLSSLVALVGVAVAGSLGAAWGQGGDPLEIESYSSDGANVVLEWSGGAPPY